MVKEAVICLGLGRFTADAAQSACFIQLLGFTPRCQRHLPATSAPLGETFAFSAVRTTHAAGEGCLLTECHDEYGQGKGLAVESVGGLGVEAEAGQDVVRVGVV